MGDKAMAYLPQPGELEVIGGRALHHLQHRLLDAGRILVLGGCLVITCSLDANTEHVLVGFLLLILGVFLIMLLPVVNQFPGTAREAAEQLANAVLNYFFAPGL